MDWIKALILGIIQGLTEFLPVSSSGHLEIAKALLGVHLEDNLAFSLVVHAATVLSTLVVFRKDIANLFSGLFRFEWNTETQYVTKIVFSAVPVIFVGVFLEDTVESFFNGNLLFVAAMLLLTAILLAFTFYAKATDKAISFRDALIIGIAQAIAVLPGISRSGATIATALILKNNRTEAARFSFLMVLLPILGKAFLDLFSGKLASVETEITPLVVGFISAFVVGFLACKLMIRIVRNSKLIYFALYCAVVAILTFIFSI